MDVTHKKMNDLQSQINHHDQEIGYLKDMLNQEESGKSRDEGDTASKKDLLQLKKLIEEVDHREKKDYKSLAQEIDSLKQQIKAMRVERVDSKTSLDEENNRTNRKSTLQKDDFNDRLNDLTAKVSYL